METHLYGRFPNLTFMKKDTIYINFRHPNLNAKQEKLFYSFADAKLQPKRKIE